MKRKPDGKKNCDYIIIQSDIYVKISLKHFSWLQYFHRTKFKDDYEALRDTLKTLPEKVTHDVMVSQFLHHGAELLFVCLHQDCCGLFLQAFLNSFANLGGALFNFFLGYTGKFAKFIRP